MDMLEQGIVVRAGVGEAYAMICAEGAGYAPDLVHDMMSRATDLVENIILVARDTGYIDLQAEEEEAVEGEEEAEEEEVVTNADIEWWIQ